MNKLLQNHKKWRWDTKLREKIYKMWVLIPWNMGDLPEMVRQEPLKKADSGLFVLWMPYERSMKKEFVIISWQILREGIYYEM